MKSKAPLALMEQIVMILIFALAAGLCLQVFTFSGQMSRNGETRDRAVTEVQNIAETLKANHGDFDEKLLCYDAEWQRTEEEDAEYIIHITTIITEEIPVGSATVCADTADGKPIYGVTVAWQEGAHG